MEEPWCLGIMTKSNTTRETRRSRGEASSRRRVHQEDVSDALFRWDAARRAEDSAPFHFWWDSAGLSHVNKPPLTCRKRGPSCHSSAETFSQVSSLGTESLLSKQVICLMRPLVCAEMSPGIVETQVAKVPKEWAVFHPGLWKPGSLHPVLPRLGSSGSTPRGVCQSYL